MTAAVVRLAFRAGDAESGVRWSHQSSVESAPAEQRVWSFKMVNWTNADVWMVKRDSFFMTRPRRDTCGRVSAQRRYCCTNQPPCWWNSITSVVMLDMPGCNTAFHGAHVTVQGGKYWSSVLIFWRICVVSDTQVVHALLGGPLPYRAPLDRAPP